MKRPGPYITLTLREILQTTQKKNTHTSLVSVTHVTATKNGVFVGIVTVVTERKKPPVMSSTSPCGAIRYNRLLVVDDKAEPFLGVMRSLCAYGNVYVHSRVCTIGHNHLAVRDKAQPTVCVTHLPPNGDSPRQVSSRACHYPQTMTGLSQQGAAVQDGLVAFCLHTETRDH